MSDEQRTRAEDNLSALITRLLKFVGVFACIWLVFYWVWLSFPALQPGSKRVVAEKQSWLRSGSIFKSNKDIRLVVFGSSRVLAGFIPETFDSLSGDRVESINFGHEGSTRVILGYLEQMMQFERKPTHVVLMECLRAPKGEEVVWQDDHRIMSHLFPFRALARDTALWLLRAGFGRGFKRNLKDSENTLLGLRQDRGYYFISGLSRFPGHQLPATATLLSDKPTEVTERRCLSTDPQFIKLRALQNRFGFKVIMAPTVIRQNRRAEASQHKPWDHPSITVIGPYYWRFANNYFSDFSHLNRVGAERYTTRLWHALSGELIESPSLQ